MSRTLICCENMNDDYLGFSKYNPGLSDWFAKERGALKDFDPNICAWTDKPMRDAGYSDTPEWFLRYDQDFDPVDIDLYYDMFGEFSKVMKLVLGMRTQTEIVCGTPHDGFSFAEEYARANSLDVTKFECNWHDFGPRAGVLRTNEMLSYITRQSSAYVAAIWAGYSWGIKYTLLQAKERNIPVFNYIYGKGLVES